MTYRHIALLTLCLSACGGAPPPPAQSVNPPPAAAAPEPEALEAPEIAEAPEPHKPRHVTVGKVEIDGGGVAEDVISKALEGQREALEACYTETRKTVADLEGRVLVTYLFVKGERKSVSASHAGMGARTINPCFHNAASEAKFEVEPSAKRTTIVVTFNLTREPS